MIDTASGQEIQSELNQEQEKEPTVSQIDPKDWDEIAKYYKFEIERGFASLHEKTKGATEREKFENMVNSRQQDMIKGKMKVAMAHEGDEIISTSVVILVSGTMRKKIEPYEAYAAGTVVLPYKKSKGIGARMAAEQDKIARDAGKTKIKTVIAQDNYPSMRLRMKVGYQLDGVEDGEDEVYYTYTKDLLFEPDNDTDWKEEVNAGRLNAQSNIDNSSPEQILIDPSNRDQVQEAFNNGYKGVYLLRDKDFGESPPFENNRVVFVRGKEEASEKTT